MKKEKILDNLSFVVGAVSILLVVCFKDNLVTCGIVAGLGAFLYGLLISLNKNTSGYLFFSLGLSLFITLLVYRGKILDKGDSFTFMICGSLFLLMLITFIFNYFDRKKIFKKYDMAVLAFVVDLVKNPNTKKEYYQPIYQFEINGEVYTVEGLTFIDKFIPKIGESIKLYVDSKNYTDVYFDKSKREKIYSMGVGLFLMIASLVILISLFI